MKQIKILFFTALLFYVVPTHIYATRPKGKEGPTNQVSIDTLKQAIASSQKMSSLYLMIATVVKRHHRNIKPEKSSRDYALWSQYDYSLQLLSQAQKVFKIQEELQNSHNKESYSSEYSSDEYQTALGHYKSTLQDYLVPQPRSSEDPNILHLRRHFDPMLTTAQLVANKITIQPPSPQKTFLPTTRPTTRNLGILKNPIGGLIIAASATLYRTVASNTPIATWMQRVGLLYAGATTAFNAHTYCTQLQKRQLIQRFKTVALERPS